MSEGTVSSPISVARSIPTASPCIHELFESQVLKTPDAVALSCGRQKLTYAQLNARANCLAQRLEALGVGPEIPVALYLERSLDMVVAILAVLKAGGAYVPIDLAYPQERAAFMLEDARAQVVLTQEHLRGALPTHAGTVLTLDTLQAPVVKEPVPNPPNRSKASNAAYVIYTSGSTGKPKGVLVTHHNVVRLLKETEPWYRFNASDVWPLFHSYAFDVSVWELWGSLLYGGRLVVVPYLVTRSPSDFYQLLAQEGVTVLNQTPSAFRQLIWAEETAPVKRELKLRYVICAGEALELQSLKPWFARHGDDTPKIVNMYGITEITVHATFRIIRQEDLTNGMGSVIGVPIPDLQLYLVDEDLKPVATGVPGEICVGGPGVARGYLNRPDLTAKRFLPDPFSAEPGAMLYRSGDLAQINARGELEYLGRMDHQVKIRGFRVELGEIESGLNLHAAVRESVVIAQDSSAGDKRLVAYVVPKTLQPSVSELREHLAKRVPDYMVPATFVFLKELPLNTNGKVDRRALPSPDGSRPELKSQYAEPTTDAERSMAGFWSEVLELDRVGIHDNFFELGGDSIRSISILSRAQQHGWRLALQDIFQNPTVASLTACALSKSGQVQTVATQPFSLITPEDKAKLPADAEDAYPLATLQLGMFYFNELNPASAIYHDVFSFRVQTRYDGDLLQKAIRRLTLHHPILRTSFHLGAYSVPLQVLHRQASVPFSCEDLSGLSSGEQDEQLAAWVDAEKRRAFNREQAPLVRFHAQLRNANTFQLIISFHHACLDGWSLAAVMTEVLQDYSALLDRTEPKSGSPRISYRDFVALEQQTIADRAHRKFWTDRMGGASAPLLPCWPKSMRAGGLEQNRGPELPVSDEVFAGLRALAQRAGVPLKTVLFAAHQRVMAALYGQVEVISGLVSNGRPEELDGEKMLGLFLNTVPVRQELGGGTWLELVQQCFAAEQDIMPHRRMPLAEIQKIAGGRPLLETAFDFVHFHVYKSLQNCRNLDLSEGHYFEANNLTTYTTFMLDVTSSHLELHIDYDPNHLCRQQVEEMSDYYLRVLEAMARNPNERYENFSPLSGAEQNRILNEWNRTEEPYPDAAVQELFEARAREKPEALALECGSVRWSYAELDRRAAQIAAELRALKAGPEELVAVCLERTPDMVAALLGVMKAGCAYVPVDPGYPSERVQLMLEDANVRILLTQESLRSSLPTTRARAVCLDAMSSDLQADIPASHGSTPQSLAYVIYTSGSTGKPKGVQINQRSVVNLLTSAGRRLGVSAQDKLLAVTTISFDIAGLELFLPLINGATLVLASRDQCADGTELASLLERSAATLMQATPATWRLLLETGWKGQASLKILCGGEALKRDLADALLKRAAEVWNFYGPTETTIWSTAWKVLPGAPVSIGRPLANTDLYILDGHLHPVPVGTVGELLIGGHGVARGYLHRPELSSEKFIANPFKPEAGLLYRTGDLARHMPNGEVECLGRIDHQVKIRGFRVEPGEVEAALLQHTGVSQAVVAAREDPQGEKRLVGYFVRKNGKPSAAELRDFINAKLPPYMVPAFLVPLTSLPLTPNGKVDINQLPAPEVSLENRKTLTPASTDHERAVSRIWSEVLGIAEVGVDENFFELGGDSLSATRVFARVNRAFGMNLTLRQMLEHPTVRLQAQIVGKQKGTCVENSAPIPKQPRKRYF